MKLEDPHHQIPDGLFRHHDALVKLERQLFAHVRQLGDLRTLSALEEIACCVLSDEVPFDLAVDVSRLLVEGAAARVIRDRARNVTSTPHSISRRERFAAFFEEGCPFCEAKIGLAPDEPEPEGDCSCCEMLVREWRAHHADALRRFSPAGGARDPHPPRPRRARAS